MKKNKTSQMHTLINGSPLTKSFDFTLQNSQSLKHPTTYVNTKRDIINNTQNNSSTKIICQNSPKSTQDLRTQIALQYLLVAKLTKRAQLNKLTSISQYIPNRKHINPQRRNQPQPLQQLSQQKSAKCVSFIKTSEFQPYKSYHLLQSTLNHNKSYTYKPSKTAAPASPQSPSGTPNTTWPKQRVSFIQQSSSPKITMNSAYAKDRAEAGNKTLTAMKDLLNTSPYRCKSLLDNTLSKSRSLIPEYLLTPSNNAPYPEIYSPQRQPLAFNQGDQSPILSGTSQQYATRRDSSIAANQQVITTRKIPIIKIDLLVNVNATEDIKAQLHERATPEFSSTSAIQREEARHAAQMSTPQPIPLSDENLLHTSVQFNTPNSEQNLLNASGTPKTIECLQSTASYKLSPSTQAKINNAQQLPQRPDEISFQLSPLDSSEYLRVLTNSPSASNTSQTQVIYIVLQGKTQGLKNNETNFSSRKLS